MEDILPPEEFEKVRENIIGTLVAVEDLDPAFLELAKEFERTGTVSSATAEKVLEIDNALRQTAFTIDRIPELVGAADAAFRKLTSGVLKTSPLSQFVSDQDFSIQWNDEML